MFSAILSTKCDGRVKAFSDIDCLKKFYQCTLFHKVTVPFQIEKIKQKKKEKKIGDVGNRSGMQQGGEGNSPVDGKE